MLSVDNILHFPKMVTHTNYIYGDTYMTVCVQYVLRKKQLISCYFLHIVVNNLCFPKIVKFANFANFANFVQIVHKGSPPLPGPQKRAFYGWNSGFWPLFWVVGGPKLIVTKFANFAKFLQILQIVKLSIFIKIMYFAITPSLNLVFLLYFSQNSKFENAGFRDGGGPYSPPGGVGGEQL